MSKIGYEHQRVKQTENVDKGALPLAHQIAGLLKRWLEGTYKSAERHHQLTYYFDEYTFRFNHRTSTSLGKLFYRRVQQAMMIHSVSGHEIVGGKGSMAHSAAVEVSDEPAEDREF